MYYFSYSGINYGSFNYRPIWLYQEASADIVAGTAQIIASAQVRSVITASSRIECNGYITAPRAIIKSYFRADLAANATLRADGIFKLYSKADVNITSHVSPGVIFRVLEEALLTCEAGISAKSSFRWRASALLTAGADVEAKSIAAIYANATIEAGAKIKATAKKAIATGLADADTYFFNFGGKCYFYNGTDYCYYDGAKVGRVTDIAYVPTITMGRAPAGGGTANEDLNYLSNSWIDSFSGTADGTEYHLSFSGLSDKPVKAWINGVEKDEATDFTVNRETGAITFSASPGEGTDNIQIQAEKDGLMSPDFINKCTQMVIYGGKNDNRVFACRGNTRYHCGLNNPAYWPENNYAVITSDAEDLVGFGKMYDYLINLKEYSLTFTTLDTDSGGDVIFPVYPLNDEYGCLAPDSIQPVANGLIFLAQTATGAPAGVVYLSPTTVRNQLNARVISEDINTSVHAGITGILEYPRNQLKSAKSFVHDKKYWLRVGDRVWVLDLRATNFATGEYCWYPYDGPVTGANCFLEHEDNFYAGDGENGAIYCEREGREGLNDGSAPINSYWTSPILYCGSRSYVKDFEELHIIFGPQVLADHTLIFITDEDREIIDINIESARIFSYAQLNYGSFHYGSNPYPSKQTELVGYSAEYLQWIVGNDKINQSLTILAQELDYLWGERS
jgi:hypothetical protein